MASEHPPRHARSARTAASTRHAANHRFLPSHRLVAAVQRSRTRLIAIGAAVAVCAALGVAAGTGHGQPARAAQSVTEVVTVPAAADTYVSAAAPAKNYARSPRLSATSQPGQQKTAYVRFAVPTTLDGTIVGAALVLTRDEHHFTGSVSLHGMSDTAWRGATMTAATAPGYNETATTLQSTTATVTDTFPVDPAMGPGSAVSFAVTSNSTSDVARFRSSQASDGRPVLKLTITRLLAARTTVPTATTVPTTGSTTPTTNVATTTVPTTTVATTTRPTTTTPPTTAPTTSTSTVAPRATTFTRPSCSVSAKLVPSCGRWFGTAPRVFTSLSLPEALAQDEAASDRPMDIVHRYHVNGDLFPSAAEKALAFQPGRNRLLYLNWKPATDMSWAAVAAGGADARIDAEANYLKSSFDLPFYLTVWHEPENDVNASPGSGMTASDFAAMFHHVVARLRADGATKFVSVLNYMGFVPWAQKSWFNQLWPGSDVVDWIGIDPYGSGDASGYKSGDFDTLINRSAAGFPGFYNWITATHPGIPVVVAEWGVSESAGNPNGKAAYFASVQREIGKYPAVKALIYFDTPAPNGQPCGNTEPDSSAASEAAWRKLVFDPAVVGPAVIYAGGTVKGE